MDPTLILIAVALAVFVFFQFRSSRKRKQDAENRLATLLPGVEVMTNFGLYGTLVSIDEEDNIALLEIAPGTIVKMHRQVILKAVEEPVEDSEDDSADGSADGSARLVDDVAGPELNQSHAVPSDEPEFGERTNDAKKPRGKRGDVND